MSKYKQLLSEINAGAYDETFAKLYSTKQDIVLQQRKRYSDAVEEFVGLYGDSKDLSLYSAPGRTEIGGNHTDHNNGIVMAAAVNLDIIAVVAKNDENIARLKSFGFANTDVVELEQLKPIDKEYGRSASLLRGMAAGIVKQGGKIGGFDAYTTSDVLRGSGLSSSAAFEVIIGQIFNGEYNNNFFDAVEIAKISQYAENVFFNKPSGLMDQTACAVGSAMTIDFKDSKNPIVNEVPFNLDKHGFALCITDTKGSHADLTDDYTAIRREMENVAQHFGKTVLREVNEEEFYSCIPQIRSKYGDRAVLRAIHFFNDCKRALQLCEAIKQDDFERFLSLIITGGHSSFEYNQNAYSISKPTEQGVALGCALSERVLAGCGAWRLQGGGFAGTIQAFVPYNKLSEYCNTLNNVFGDDACHVLSVRNYGAISVEKSL
ncbi:MAG: galactokinase family protein [Oscillospiraceae bacterium]